MLRRIINKDVAVKGLRLILKIFILKFHIQEDFGQRWWWPLFKIFYATTLWSHMKKKENFKFEFLTIVCVEWMFFQIIETQ